MKLIKTLHYRPQGWDNEMSPPEFKLIQVKIYENDDGLLNLNFENNGDTFLIISKVCPRHFQERHLDYYWMGLECGYEIACEHFAH